jgi:hypothetical protein
MDIACTLSATAMSSRRERWERLIARAGLARETTPEGVRLRFRADPGTLSELRLLAAAERRCCAWAAWSVVAGEGEGGVTLVVRSAGDAVAALHAMFTGQP